METPMTDTQILDIAHVTFLEMIDATIKSVGPNGAKGSLMRAALRTADTFPVLELASWDDYFAAIDDVSSPIARVEGRARHYGDGLFGLPHCPFAQSIANFVSVYEKLPAGYGQLTDEFNRPSAITKKYRVGHGAGVSPFCAIHQPLRSALGMRIKIGGKPMIVFQLGCKSGSGHKGIADEWVAEAGFDRQRVAEVLDDNMCCYGVRLDAAD